MEHTVLFIDDDPNLLRGLCRALRHQPFKILTARSAEEALDVVKAWPIDLVVSDEQMPGDSGTVLLSWMARECPDVVRIILTGNATPDVAMRAVNEGRVFRFFTKPCNPLDLAVAIREGFEVRSLVTSKPGQV